MINMNPEAKALLTVTCVNKLADKSHPAYMLKVREERVNSFFKDKIEGWLKEIQLNSSKKKLGDLLGKVKEEVSEMWDVLSPHKIQDEKAFLIFWYEKVQQIKQELIAGRRELIRNSSLESHVKAKYLSCSDDDVCSPRRLTNLKASWKKEAKRWQEIQEMEVSGISDLVTAHSLKQKYVASREYWSRFPNQLSQKQKIDDRVEELDVLIATYKSDGEAKEVEVDPYLDACERISVLEGLIIRYKNKILEGEDIRILLTLHSGIIDELEAFDERGLTASEKGKKEEAHQSIAQINRVLEQFKEAIADWDKALSEDVCIKLELVVTDEPSILCILDPVVTFNHQLCEEIRIKTIEVVQSMNKFTEFSCCFSDFLTKVKDVFFEMHNSVLSANESLAKKKVFLEQNIKTYRAYFDEMLKQEISMHRTENNPLKSQVNRANVQNLLTKHKFEPKVIHHIMIEYDEMCKSFPNDFSVFNYSQAWDNFIDIMQLYVNWFHHQKRIIDMTNEIQVPESGAAFMGSKLYKDGYQQNFLISAETNYFGKGKVPEWVIEMFPQDRNYTEHVEE